MNEIKIAIIGAGSSYTPELIEGLVKERDSLPVNEIVFHDIDERRLEIMTGFCRRFLRRLGSDIQITPTSDRRQAIEGARFIDVQIRVGGNAQRVLDEKIPLKYGVIGQETTGPGGMMKALRTIPVMLDIAREVERCNPQAWIINYTNPTGLVTEAATKYTHARIAGLCSGGLFPQWRIAEALNVPQENVGYDYAGLNHLSFAFNITVNGRPVTDEEFSHIADVAARDAVDATLIRQLRMIPSPYLQYYYHTARKVNQLRNKPRTRGEEVQALEREVFAAYADEACHTRPAALDKRGGGGYSDVAISVMKAIHTSQERLVIVNVPNRGAIQGLPDDAVVEIPCLVNAAGIHGLNVPEVPRTVWGLIAAVKNYEQLAVEAAVSGSRHVALMALLAHPLVREYEIAVPLLDELLEANRAYLPQFFKPAECDDSCRRMRSLETSHSTRTECDDSHRRMRSLETSHSGEPLNQR
jgi:6-phospho-beta-glucosidase